MGALRSVRMLVACVSKKLVNGGDQRRTKQAEIAPSWAPYLSRKTGLLPFRGKRRKRNKQKRSASPEELKSDDGSSFEEGEKERGVWQRTILMGDKCDPLAFSGVIYYDSHGRRLSGVPPRSPLRSPLPSFHNPAILFSPSRDSN